MFLQGNGTLSFNADNGALYTLSDAVADVQGSGGGNGSGSWGLRIDGDGTGGVTLDASNSYTGPTEVVSGGLEVDGSVMSLTSVDTGGVLVGIGTAAATVINNGVVAPGNATTTLITGQPPGNYRFTVTNYSQGSDARLDIGLDGSGDSTQLAVINAAGLAGTLHLQFDESPAPGTTYTVLTAGSLSSTFTEYKTNMHSVFGEISYSPHSVLFTVVANDLVFRDGFEGSNTGYAGTCISKAQFTAIPGAAVDNLSICIPPFTSTVQGNTVVACQTSMCSAAVAGCLTTLHAGIGTLSGTLANGTYRIDTPIGADTITAPLNISGFAGNVNCTATASNNSADLTTDYSAARDPFGDAFVYAFDDVQANSLNTSLSSSGCGLYGTAISAFGPYLIPQLQAQLNAAINSAIPSGATAPGVDATICPAP
jgi:autotransporter-associated beta strand protein